MTKQFNVIIHDFNSGNFTSYDVIPYLISEYKKLRNKDKPNNLNGFVKFIDAASFRQWFSRCEYEFILKPWVGNGGEIKVDIYWQIKININIVAEILMDETKK